MADSIEIAEPLKRMTDLVKVAAALSKEAPHLGKIVQKALNAQSCLVDMRMVTGFLKALDEIRSSWRRQGTEYRTNTETALVVAAVSAYARATFTQSEHGDRGGFDIRAKLSAEEKVEHMHLIDVRNQVLAHVYPDREVSGEIWHTVSLVLVEQESGGWLPAAAGHRLNRDEATIERLRRMAPIADCIIRDGLQKRMNRLVIELQELQKACDVISVFVANPFDAELSFGSDDAASALSGEYRAGEYIHGYF